MLDLVYDPTVFVIMAVFARIWEGISYAVIQSTTYGVSSQELPPNEFDKYARLNSASSGVGMSVSLIMGSLLFQFGGYMFPYFALGTVFILLATTIYITGAFSSSNKINEENNSDILQIDHNLSNAQQYFKYNWFSYKRNLWNIGKLKRKMILYKLTYITILFK